MDDELAHFPDRVLFPDQSVGGLIGGIASWYAGRIKIVGVEPELAPTLFRALEAGHPAIAAAMSFADLSDTEEGRLASERATERKRRTS